MELFEETPKHKENAEIFDKMLIEIQIEHNEYFKNSNLNIRKDFFATEFNHATKFFGIYNMVNSPNEEEKKIYEKIKIAFLNSFEIKIG